MIFCSKPIDASNQSTKLYISLLNRSNSTRPSLLHFPLYYPYTTRGLTGPSVVDLYGYYDTQLSAVRPRPYFVYYYKLYCFIGTIEYVLPGQQYYLFLLLSFLCLSDTRVHMYAFSSKQSFACKEKHSPRLPSCRGRPATRLYVRATAKRFSSEATLIILMPQQQLLTVCICIVV